VTLSVVAGQLNPTVFTAKERITCIIGRASDCVPHVPDDAAHRTVSRHHCLLDINPPDIRIRDFGSRNGTYLNETKIGQRQPGQSPEDAGQVRFPEHDLSDGDEIRIGPTTIRVSIQVPAPPSRQLPDSMCASCGQEIEGGTDDAGTNVICASCREDPEQVARCLLRLARAGNPQLGLLAMYDVARELGRGGMGAVYLIRHRSTREERALKLMLPRTAGTPEGRARFLREAGIASALRHPNIVESHGMHTAGGVYAFTSEYCSAGSLGQLLEASGGWLSPDDAVPIIIDVLNGLEHAHRQRVVHRDLSPANILLADGPGGARVAKVGDFGLAKLFDLAGLSGLTHTGEIVGKPSYMPRQQIINFRSAEPAVDVWAAVACLYRMLAGTCPRDFPPGHDPWHVVLQNPAVPIRRRNPLIPPSLADIIDAALREDPDIACQSAAELRDRLCGFLCE
jgi:hypothetical protein